MPKLSHSVPKYRKHKASGQAIVTVSGVDHYLGPYGTNVSKLEYDRLVASGWPMGAQSSGTRTIVTSWRGPAILPQ